MLSAPVPRNLRVRASIQLGGTRVRARAFLLCAGLLFLGGLLVVAGTDLLRTVRLTGTGIVIALVVFELRCWGRSTREVVMIFVRHARRPRRLRPVQPWVVLPPKAAPADALRRPRWQQ